MASAAKTRRLCRGTAVDRLSNLPGNVIDLILEPLPVRDIARMSIFSKRWRDVLVLHPHLVFDDLFFEPLLSKKDSEKDTQAQVSEISRIISNILLVHTGPISTFHLFIPQDLPLHRCVDTDFWIRNISNRVQKLKLLNKPFTMYKIPLYLFSCLKLTHLHLTNCILNPPLRFRGFCNLLSVELEDVVIRADMSFGTQLEKLELTVCTGIKHLGCQFTYKNNLTRLIITDCGEFDFEWFECIQKVEFLAVRGVLNSRNELINWNKLFANFPRINTLGIDGFFLEDCEVSSSDEADLLDFMAFSADMILEKLEIVEIRGVVGSRAELQLIKLLLACTPRLRRIELEKDITVDAKEELRISRELLQIPRASTSSQIIWN
ncbi:F-box/FBD/LRR-repeat protein At1g13570-like isoform X2 [Apium graveolens]|uniref:F-box/FBD/LRR-repeat protein At1g13570-like isoform X2 n=1 Tax=Apium graveolens TaxID=4045 RepID=UPI003D78DF0E